MIMMVKMMMMMMMKMQRNKKQEMKSKKKNKAANLPAQAEQERDRAHSVLLRLGRKLGRACALAGLSAKTAGALATSHSARKPQLRGLLLGTARRREEGEGGGARGGV